MKVMRWNDLVRRGRLANLPTDIPTIYKSFGIAALTDTVRKLLARD
jgi:hypothetical protein